MRRRFVVVAHDLGELEEYSPLAVRCISAGIMLSHRLRHDADVALVAGDDLSVLFNAPKLRNVRPDESSLMGIIRKALRALEAGATGPVHSGVLVCRRGVRHFLRGFSVKCYCSQRGADLYSLIQRGGSMAVVAPLVRLSTELARSLESMGATALRCPLDRYWPDQLIALLNILMDRWCERASSRHGKQGW